MSISLSRKSPLRAAARLFLGFIAVSFSLIFVLALSGCGNRPAIASELDRPLTTDEANLVSYAAERTLPSRPLVAQAQPVYIVEPALVREHDSAAMNPGNEIARDLRNAALGFGSLLEITLPVAIPSEVFARLFAQLAYLQESSGVDDYQIVISKVGQSLAYGSGNVLPGAAELRRLRKLADSYVPRRIYIAVGVADPVPFQLNSIERQEILARARGERLLTELDITGIAVSRLQTAEELKQYGPQRGVELYAVLLVEQH